MSSICLINAIASMYPSPLLLFLKIHPVFVLTRIINIIKLDKKMKKKLFSSYTSKLI